jgi:hypothetical protein
MAGYTPGPWTANLSDADFVDVEAPFEGDIVGIVATCPTGGLRSRCGGGQRTPDRCRACDASTPL